MGTVPPVYYCYNTPPTYTFGRRGEADNLLWDEAELANRGIEVHWVDRGGDVTYHGPGQLVGYPLLPLGSLHANEKPDYMAYLRKLEQTIILALMEFGVVSGQMKGLTGVWVQPDMASRCPHCPPALKKHPTKIASIGVKIDSRGISRHGFALNVNPDMRHWEGIIACGLGDYKQISLAHLLDPVPSLKAVSAAIVDALVRYSNTNETCNRARYPLELFYY